LSILIAGLVSVRLTGVRLLRGDTGYWVRTVLGPLASAAHGEADVTIRFAPDVRPRGPELGSLPVGIAGRDEVWVADPRGRPAVLPLADLGSRPVTVDTEIDPWAFESWVFMPLVRAALWKHGASLIHAAGAVVDGRAVALAGWTGSGKTRVVMELLARGADLLGDDWLALTPEGLVAPVQGHVDLTLDSRRREGFRGAPRLARRAGMAVTRWGTARLGRLPRVSKGLARLGDPPVVVAPVGRVFPGSRVAGPSPLDTLVLLVPPGVPTPPPAASAEVIGIQNQMYLREGPAIESAFRLAFPGRLEVSMFPAADEECRMLAKSLSTARLLVARLAPTSAGIDAVLRTVEGALR
jgi:hypothetical protein